MSSSDIQASVPTNCKFGSTGRISLEQDVRMQIIDVISPTVALPGSGFSSQALSSAATGSVSSPLDFQFLLVRRKREKGYHTDRY